MTHKYCIINGRLIAEENARISIEDRGFRYGDGVFETMAVTGGVPYQFDWHIERLTKGLKAIKIPYDTADLQEYCRQLLHKNAVSDGLLRLQVTRGIGSKGYLPDETNPQAGATLVIEISPVPEMRYEKMALWQSSYRKISARALPVQAKLCNGLNSALVRMEALENHCFDGLLLNEKEQLCETSSGNLFWFAKDMLYTPSLACDVLEGSTRAAILRLSPYPVREVESTLGELAAAEAVFATNVVWKAMPVMGLMPASMGWQSEKIALQFRQLLNDDRAAYRMKHQDAWDGITK